MRGPRRLPALGNEPYLSHPAFRPSRTWVSLGLAGAGVLMGLVAFERRETPLGSVALGAAGSLAAIGVAFLLMDLLGARVPDVT